MTAPAPAARARPHALLGWAAVAVALAAADTYVVVLALTEMMQGVGLGIENLQRAAPIISGTMVRWPGRVRMTPPQAVRHRVGRDPGAHRAGSVVGTSRWAGQPCTFGPPRSVTAGGLNRLLHATMGGDDGSWDAGCEVGGP